MRGGRTLGVGNFGMEVCVNITVLGFHEPSSSEERNFSRVAGSASGHLALCPLADRCSVVYQLQRTIEFPSLQGSPQSLASVSPLRCTVHSIPLSRCVCVCGESLWDRFQVVPSAFHAGSSNCDLLSNSHAVITPIRMPREVLSSL